MGDSEDSARTVSAAPEEPMAEGTGSDAAASTAAPTAASTAVSTAASSAASTAASTAASSAAFTAASTAASSGGVCPSAISAASDSHEAPAPVRPDIDHQPPPSSPAAAPAGKPAAAAPCPESSAQRESSAPPAKPPAIAIDIGSFKRPMAVPTKRKRFKKTVLDEDNYIRELEGIVERDFFPDLRRLRAQNDYLSAAQSGDTVRLHELRRRYGSAARRRPDTADSWSSDAVAAAAAATPETFETPRPGDSPAGSTASGTAPGGAEDDETEKPLSLNQYLATHTSEDDESFSEMMSEARRRHRVRHPWLYEAEAAHNTRQAALLALDVPSVEEQAAGGPRPGQVATWRYTSENDLMYAPRGLALTAAEKIERAKHGQEIQTDNTRFVASPFDESQRREVLSRVAQAQSRRNCGQIDVDGRAHVEPVKRGLVRTPSPAPGVDATPLMTWGQIDGTPFRLDGGDTPAAAAAPATPTFRILEASRRERLAHELVERASSRHRDKKARALETARRQQKQAASPAGSDRLAGMSPAARRLAKVGCRTTDRALRASYTPSPARRRATPAAASPSPARLTPATTPAGQPGRSSITDNLLQLPKRARAADFFT